MEESTGKVSKKKKHIAAQAALKRLDSAINRLADFVKCIETGEQETLLVDETAKKPAQPDHSLEHFLSELEELINTKTDRIRKAVEEATQKLY